jgi:DNA-binding SARP family transcriptional activator
MANAPPRTNSFESRFHEALTATLAEDSDCLSALDVLWQSAQKKANFVAALAISAVAVNHIHHSWSSFAGLETWLGRLADGLSHEGQLTNVADQIRVHCAATVAHHLSDHEFDDCVPRGKRLNLAIAKLTEHGGDQPADVLFSAARSLLDLIEIENHAEGFEAIMLLLEARRKDPKLSPLWLGRALVYGGRCYLRFNLDQKRERFRERALKAWRDARLLGRKHHLQPLQFDVAHAEILDATTRGETDALPLLLADMEQAVDAMRPMQLSEYFIQRTKLALHEEDAQTAATASADAMRYAKLAHAPEKQFGAHVLARVWSLTLAQDFATARLTLTANIAVQRGRPKEILLCIDTFLLALAARAEAGSNSLASADTAPIYRQRLADAFARSVALKWPNYLSSLPKLATMVSADALNAGIESVFVRATIAQRKLPPPEVDCPSWPWPLEILTFGGFVLKRFGERVEFEGKVQKKPLELLKCIASTGFRGVSIHLLSEMLWPDAEPEQARSSFKVTLSRLRALLAVPNAIDLTETRVALNRDIVSTDCERFDTLADALENLISEAARNEGSPELTIRIVALAERVSASYVGSFLGDEAVNRWLESARVRWHARFIRLIGQAGAQIETGHTIAAAIRLYERAVERDATAEELHRRLIAAYLAQGENAQAMNVFLRLRHNLALLLGVMPSEKTLALIAPLKPATEVRVDAPSKVRPLRLS